jgi:hypothetical protein
LVAVKGHFAMCRSGMRRLGFASAMYSSLVRVQSIHTSKKNSSQVLQNCIKVWLFPGMILLKEFHPLRLSSGQYQSPPTREAWNLTFWQTTQSGNPRGSDHSPGPCGKELSPSPPVPAAEGVPSRFMEPPPRPLTLHDSMISSIRLCSSEPSFWVTDLKSATHWHI